jgi:hypothetical protein
MRQVLQKICGDAVLVLFNYHIFNHLDRFLNRTEVIKN